MTWSRSWRAGAVIDGRQAEVIASWFWRPAAENRRADGLGLDTLSMGMSDDLEAAIAAGSTMVRVGTAIFGSRAPKP